MILKTTEVLLYFESYIEKEMAVLTISALNCDPIQGGVFLKDSPTFKDYINHSKRIIKSKNNHKYFYENGYANLGNHIKRSFINDIPIVVIIRVNITGSSYFDNNSKIMWKLYSFLLKPEYGGYEVIRIPAKDLLHSCTQCSVTGDDIPAEQNVIYMGVDNKDLICGFDL